MILILYFSNIISIESLDQIKVTVLVNYLRQEQNCYQEYENLKPKKYVKDIWNE